jgi:hypothetical protein
VDNLDRIGETEIKEVWGMLRSFLDNPSFSGKAWFKHLWVIIPIANAANLVPSVTDQKEPRASVANCPQWACVCSTEIEAFTGKRF